MLQTGADKLLTTSVYTQSFILPGEFQKMFLDVIFFGFIFLPIAFTQNNLKLCKCYYYYYCYYYIFNT
jgi:hypothetical protein